MWGQVLLRGVVRFEAPGRGGLCVLGVAHWIERRLAALGRGQRDQGARIMEHIVGGGELFEPEARLLAGVAELLVRSQNH